MSLTTPRIFARARRPLTSGWSRFRTIITVLYLLVSGLSTASFAQSEEISELESVFNAIENPTVTGEMDPPETLSVGRAVIRPGQGSRLYVLSAGGRKVGYWLEGPAELVYRVEDRYSVPPAQHSLKEADGIETHVSDGVLTASTHLTGAAVWAWDLDLGDGSVQPVTDRGLPTWLTEILDSKYSPNPARDLLVSDRHKDPGYRWALFHAKREDLVLDVDPRPLSRSENLSRLLKPQKRPGPLSRRRFSQQLISQPIARSWWQAGTLEFVSTDTEINVSNQKRDHVKVTTRTRLQSQRDGLRLLSMRHLDGVFNNKNQWREYRLLSLTLDGRPATYIQRDQDLLIALPRTAKRGDSFLLELEAEGEILVRPAGDNYWRLGGQAWYPKPDAGGEEWAEFKINAEVQSPFVVFAPGEILKAETREGMSRVQTHLKGPMRTAMVIAGKYRTVTTELDGSRIHISSYATVKKKSADRIGQLMFSVMDCYKTWLGVAYPFQDLQVVEVNQWGWGQAPPGLIFITQEAFLTKASAQLGDGTRSAAAVFSRGINERVAHEVAHAWFPHIAKVVRPEENWLSESLSDYVSAFCLQQRTANKRKGKELFERQLKEWKNHSKEAKNATSVYLANHLAGTSDNSRIRQRLLYGRGPLVLHAIRRQLNRKHGEEEGDRLFLTWIRSYITNFTFKIAETRHLITILEQVTGEDWQPFFERYIYGVEAPELD